MKVAVKTKLTIDINIERAHRVERKHRQGKESSQPRAIVWKLRDWKQREQLLSKAHKEKLSGIHISEDFALPTLKKRESLIPKLKAAKEAGNVGYIVLDRRLVIRDDPKT